MERKKERVDGGLVYRGQVRAQSAILDEENRTIRVSFSSEDAKVLRGGFFQAPWYEVLGHDRSEVNLERLESGAPVLLNHARGGIFNEEATPIGVVESAEIKNGRGEATIRLSKRSSVDDIWADVRDGILQNISVGYSIDERTLTAEKEGEPDEYRVTRWTPAEISIVDIPADHSVGIGRSESGTFELRGYGAPEGEMYRIVEIQSEEKGMDPKDKKDTSAGDDANRAAPQPEVVTVVDESATAAARDKGTQDGIRAENQRQSEIRALFTPAFAEQLGTKADEIRSAALEDTDATVDSVRAQLLDALGSVSQSASADPRIEVGESNERAGITEALEVRAGLQSAPDNFGENHFRGHSLQEMARASLEAAGHSTGRLTRLELVGRAFTTSDFPLILADVANKSMKKGFDEAPETWNRFCQVGNLSDFKTAHRVNLSSFDDLEVVRENGEYKYGQFDEEKETIQLATYGKLFSLSRQAIINDDLQAFTVIPNRMGRAAARVPGDLAYGVITGNPTMNDGTALFAGTAIGTDHGNLNIGGAAAISATSVAAMRVAMARQTDKSGNANGLNIRPSYILVPLELEDTANILMQSEFDPADGTNNNRAPNPVRGSMEVVTDVRLSADSTTRWYMASSAQFDTIEVAFLDGVQAPMLEQQNGWTVDGTEFKVRLDCGAAPMDFRTWQRNDGA